MQIFIDESGDLGFTSRSTNYFVVSYIIPESPWLLRKKLKHLLKRLHRQRKYSGRELHFTNSNDFVRCRVLKKINEISLIIGIVVVEKQKVSLKLRHSLNILYNYLIVHTIMRNVLLWMDESEKLELYIDKSLSKSNREAFNDYVQRKANWVWCHDLEHKTPLSPSQIKVEHKFSQNDYCLQAADYIAGATFQKYEHNNDCFYRIFEGKIKAFDYLWR
ncbi:DUF3800 domain-containing protein [Candidatus Bathyarchaeota archaeon]|nr:MAG: DUF3800 domain-containing protein [Candidatus Bathyarchaeota archaeon]